jgi:hypothetical protein
MKAWMPVTTLVLAALVASSVSGQDKVLLKNEHKPGDGWNVKLDMSLTGKIKIKDGEKTVTLDLKAEAKHHFEERVLTVRDGLPTGMGRFYKDARADITLQGKTIAKTLRPARRFQAYSPDGPLTDEELELTGEHFDVLALHGVLPNKEVAIGEKWELPLPVAQALAGVDGIISAKLECAFNKIERGHALLQLSGNVEGITKGAVLKAEIAAWLVYSLQDKRFTGCTWRHSETKDHGPLNPAVEYITDIHAAWQHGATRAELTDGKVATIPTAPPAPLLLLEFRDAANRFSFHYERGWGIVNKSEKQTVLRLLERGELIAQLNITPYHGAKPGDHVSLDELNKMVTEAPGFKVDKVLEKTSVDAAPGFWIGKVSATGEASELPMHQIVYAVAGPRGDQLLLAFTVETEHAAKLAGRDLSLVKTVGLPTLQTTGGK